VWHLPRCCHHLLGVCQEEPAGQVWLFVLQLQFVKVFALGLLQHAGADICQGEVCDVLVAVVLKVAACAC
jgi:hypothetical protein